jgi:Rrf2 family protein
MQLAASYGSGEPVRIGSIAAAHGIPPRFLVQILLQLKGAGLVASTRGAAGGYQLIKDPAHISLAEVMSVIEGAVSPVRRSCARETPQAGVLLGVWNEVGRVQQDMLADISFQDLLERTPAVADHMYYI